MAAFLLIVFASCLAFVLGSTTGSLGYGCATWQYWAITGSGVGMWIIGLTVGSLRKGE